MQNQTPLFTKLVEHANRNPIQFHIPAHKKGFGMPNEFSEFIGPNALSIDLINIAPLDDLHSPKGVIKEAQELAARAYGADHTYFSVHGTSGAIMTMVMSAVGPGEKILVPRNVHKSVLSAIIFSGAHPVFMHPEIDPEIGIAHGVPLDEVRKVLDEHPDAKALLLINPTYFGVSADLKSIVDLAHERGVPVLVDEAHGVLFSFHEDLPLSAMQAGADMAATSVHKLGGSMTQSSVLNVREGLISPEHVQSVLSMLHTTSTSYLLLASLDVARKNLAIHGHELISKTLELAHDARRRINAIDGLYCFGEEILKTSATFAHDPLKINVTVSNLGLTGWEVEKILRNDFNIEVEMSDLYNILCIITFGDTQETIDALVHALEAIAKDYRREVLERKQVKYPSMPLLALSPRDAFYNKQTEIIPLAEAAGRIIAEFIMVYPPGIPIVMPGEVVTHDNIDYIVEHVKEGLPVQGPDDPNIEFVKVLK
ncbi:aminotransferase class I/II-fold pyridoxal phosphate-dependent enzyme [Tumebacillus flagellatus]|uniref:aminotransferase class I/II-fold pyridoxal phosphate-dependent enzyme n=1 Tax=Tumebacillus flagellatus TaxID=1157490 RepID=UPI000571264E|nr:aminotransferase class I/II-fold pyridoxal phosphate-dependent enzyme [Tumebacillus flagellatus]